MELDGVELALLVGDGGERRTLRHADSVEAWRQRGDAVAVAHPHLTAFARLPHSVEKRAGRRHLEERSAELAMIGGLDLAAELRAHGLLAVADAEHRDTVPEEALGRLGTLAFMHARRPTRQDDP